MIIRRVSKLTGKENVKDIPLDPEDYAQFQLGENIDVVMPYLTDDDKDFILYGITVAEWKLAFSEEKA